MIRHSFFNLLAVTKGTIMATQTPPESTVHHIPQDALVDAATQTCDATMNFVKENPVTATMVAAGLGVGVGIVLSKMIAESIPKPRTRSTIESIGQQVMDSLSNTLPDMIAKHLPGN